MTRPARAGAGASRRRGRARDARASRAAGGTLDAELDPDELRIDDRRAAEWCAWRPVARVNWDAASRYVAAACEVLEANRRIGRGNEVTLGRLAPGSSIVQPPEDGAAIGALNRALAARGVAWRYGAPVLEPGDDRQRAARRPHPGAPAVSAAAGRERAHRGARYRRRHPLAGAHGDVVLLGSRLEPAWTDLPVSAGFMPFMDALAQPGRTRRSVPRRRRARRRRAASRPGLRGAPGRAGWRVEGGGTFRPAEPGVVLPAGGADTVGAITANIDPRESRLAPASDAQARRLWHGARVGRAGRRAGDAAFSPRRAGDLRGPLLVGRAVARPGRDGAGQPLAAGAGDEAPVRCSRRSAASPAAVDLANRLPARG